VKIGLVDSEIDWLILKKKKLPQAKYIARLASVPSGLKSDNHWSTVDLTMADVDKCCQQYTDHHHLFLTLSVQLSM